MQKKSLVFKKMIKLFPDAELINIELKNDND